MNVDITPLTEYWKPPKLLIRDKELNILLENLGRPTKVNFWIYGGRGVGKTLTVNFLKDKMNIYQNSMVFITRCGSTVAETIKRLAWDLEVKPKSDIDLTIKSITKKIKEIEDEYRRIVIVFDDIDNLSSLSRRKFSVILSDLYDTLKNEIKYSFILISSYDYSKRNVYIDSSTESRLSLNPLPFPPYSVDEMLLLLKQRLQFIDGIEIDEEALAFICEKVSRMINADFRKALELTREALIEGNGVLSLKSVFSVYTREKKKYWSGKIRELKYFVALLLRSVVERVVDLMKKKGLSINDGSLLPVAWTDVMNHFYKLCEIHGIKDLPSRPYLYQLLEHLENIGYIEIRTLPKYDERNYTFKRQQYVFLRGELENLIPALEEINWNIPW